MNLKPLTPGASPGAAFGDQLRRSRNEKGWTQAQAGERLGVTGSHLSGLETARKLPGRKFAARADAVFGTGLTFQILWQAIRNQAFLEGFPEYLQEELKATEVRMFELDVIPGPLQTPDYATALARADAQRGTITEEQASERVALLKTRQQRLLSGSGSPFVYVVLNEGCLHRVVGGRKVMAGQFDYLSELARKPKATIQVAPFAMGERRPFALPVVLLTLPDRTMIGYAESAVHGHLERDAESVTILDRKYHQLQVGALSEADSLDVIRAAWEALA